MNKKKQILYILVCSLVLTLFLWKFGGANVFYKAGNLKEYMTTVSTENAGKILNLEEGGRYQQTIKGTRDEIVGFTIRFGTYEQQVQGKLKISFSDLSGEKIYYSQQMDCKEIIDNQYHLFRLDNVITDGWNKEYIISVEVISLAEKQQLAIFLSTEDLYKGGFFIQDGKEFNGNDMACQFVGTSGYLTTWYLLGAAIIVAGFLVFAYVAFVKRSKIEYVYLVLSLVFGLIFILCFPPYTAPDEEKHISTVYAYANSFLGEYPIFSETDSVILRQTDGDIGVGGNAINSAKFEKLYEALKYPSKESERNLEGFTNLNVSFIYYIPQVIGVMLGIFLKLSGFWTIYLGKLFALLFFTGCIFFSIKIIPWGKMAIMVIALLPMSMEMTTSYSYDGMINALSILFISYAVHLIFKKEKVEWKDIFALGILISAISACKFFYFFIAGILYLIPKEKYKSKKMYWVANTAVFLVGFIALMVAKFQFFAGHIGEATQNAGDPSTVNYSIATILGNIPNSITVLFNTFIRKSEFYFNTLWGNELGWFQVYIPNTVITGFVFVLSIAGGCSVKGEKTQYMPDKKFRIVNIGLSIIMFLGILASLWIGWTAITFSEIDGVQGRYFLPFLPMIVLSMKNKIFVLNKNIDRWLAGTLFVLLSFTYLYIVPYVVQ